MYCINFYTAMLAVKKALVALGLPGMSLKIVAVVVVLLLLGTNEIRKIANFSHSK